MASEGSQYNEDPLFVSPERLMLDGVHRRDSAQQQTSYGHAPPKTHHQTVWASQQTNQERPVLSMHATAVSDWTIPTAQTFRTNLPPTPISPFRPLRPLSEDEKLAFPCTGSLENCWNPVLCPKHQGYSKPAEQRTTPPDVHAPRPDNPRRRSAPATNLQPPPAKIKRSATEPEEADHSITGRQRQFSMNRDPRSSISRGRVPHNLVERRYRDNLNNQIESLRLTLPSLKDAQPGDLDDTASPRMPSKAVIISTAATYINDMENERTRLLAANKALQEQVSSLQKLVRCDDCSIMGYLNAIQINNAAAAAATASQMTTPGT
ncbi:Sterol regulatory element-binding 1 [Lecanosticta acicola]|uniref:Sterol regulatory element-binding 1 n=1 Tax=Lecanosticta acicola TaxID=111012 RepID=A0AAI8Z6X7_9PEZI|nr:Sterol regulatory element-binding 1 [Lecanosticta acicola]